MTHQSAVRIFRRALLGLPALLVLAPALPAGDDGLNVEIQKLTLFKNGLGFVVCRAALPGNTRTVRIGRLPVPSFGTFWIGYPKEVKVQGLFTSMEDVERNVPPLNIGQLVLASTGRRVIVHTGDRDIDGTVLPALAPEGRSLVPSPYIMSPRSADPYAEDSRAAFRADILLIRTDKGTVAMSPGAVVRAEFPDRDPVVSVPFRTQSPSLRMQLEEPAGGENVTISYLAHGVSWVPGYMIDLSDPKTAKVSAHAEIINEMIDVDHVSLQLVTGFPNLKYGEILSPLAMSQKLSEFLRSLAEGGNAQGGGRSMLMSQVALMSNSRSDAESSPLVPGYSTATEGMSAEDLFFYPVKDFTLKKNETAWIPLFTSEMPYRHIYTWKIADFMDENEHYRADPDPADRKKPEEVWHSCRLSNTLAMPLTTASAEFVTNGEFTGQDICYYTPPKSETTIRINKALNIVAEQAEREIERKRDASVIHGYHYDLVKIRGELTLRSRIDRKVSVEITKELSGDVIEAVPHAGDVKTASGLRRVNTKHILTWDITLNPGDEGSVSYQYQVLFRE